MPIRVPLRAVVFDWDGTLLDSYRADARAYLQMFSALGIACDLDKLKRYYSPNWHNVYRAAGIPVEQWKEADRLWWSFYRDERPLLYPGARRVLLDLARHYALGLVSSGSGLRVRRQLCAFAVNALFAARVFGDETPRRKPHPAQLLMSLQQLGCEPAACVYVGDAPEDVEMARRAGVFAIGVIGQSPVPQRLRQARPDATIPYITALPRLLAQC